MARKFVDLEEAAQILGVTPDTLSEMRDRREVHGYRDGSSWKFKQEDIERVKADRDAAREEGEFAELDEDPDSILLSEVELGASGESTSSTIIGGKSGKASSPDSDIQLAQPKHDSNVDLDAPLVSEDAAGGSDVLAAGSGVSPMFDDLDNLDLEMPSAADSGISSKIISPDAGGSAAISDPGSSDITLGSDALQLEGSALSFGDDEPMSLGDEGSLQLEDAKSGGSDIDLMGDIDDDLVLGGSSHGDVSRAGDSGISLLDPADSGLSLESAPLQLGGSGVESLELGEEDDLLMEEEPAAKAPPAKKPAGAKKPAAVIEEEDEEQSDDDFLLTPLEEAAGEESDSGSQVIALESDVEFEDAGGLEPAGGGLLEEDLGAGLSSALEPAAAPAAAGGRMPAAAPAMAGGGAYALPDVPFSGWNVASLVMCAVLLLFCGMFMYDLLRNMWSWNGSYSVNSSLMDMVLSWFE